MFTGIIEELGRVRAIERHTIGAKFFIESSLTLEGTKIGDSLSLNGCCLTVVEIQDSTWTCDVVQETLNKTNLNDIQVGEVVNLERAVRLQDRLGGHLVQGHVDQTGTIIEKVLLNDHSFWVTIGADPSLIHYLIIKGSIAVDGVSLTIASLSSHSFSFAMIPHTAQMTTLGVKEIGQRVNLEIDLMAKYVERLLQANLAKEN